MARSNNSIILRTTFVRSYLFRVVSKRMTAFVLAWLVARSRGLSCVVTEALCSGLAYGARGDQNTRTIVLAGTCNNILKFSLATKIQKKAGSRCDDRIKCLQLPKRKKPETENKWLNTLHSYMSLAVFIVTPSLVE